MTTLYLSSGHEAPTSQRWSEEAVLERVREIVADAEQHFDPDTWWPLHSADEEYLGDDVYTTHPLWTGAAGVLWALDALARVDAIELSRDYRVAASRLHEDYLARVDAEHPAVPGLWVGEAGILLVADRIAPDASRAARLLECVDTNAENETLELMWGAPGTMLAAQVMLERTGDERWRTAWLASADALLAAQDPETGLWTQSLYGQQGQLLGSAHGFAGNVAVLLLGRALLDDHRRIELVRRATEAVQATAVVEDGRANWPTRAGNPLETNGEIRAQWCHGAPGIVCSLSVLPADDHLDELLVAGGELTWDAGPLSKGPGLCHGTAGNGFALLALHERTGDERWLERARVFATHALEQVDRARGEQGRGRFSLWTGDLGAALFAWQCIRGDHRFPTVEWW